MVLDIGAPEYKAMMAPLPAVIKLEELLAKIILWAVSEVVPSQSATNLIAGAVVTAEVLLVVTILLTVKLPVLVCTKIVPVDDRPE